jgi:hypothetical protein
MSPITGSATRHTWSTQEYLADPAPLPSLSSSIANVILDQSPAHARQQHPRLGDPVSEHSAATDLGSVIHRLILGQGADYVLIDAGDFRTKAAREARNTARSSGKVPILVSAWESATDTARVILERLADARVELSGDSEVGIQWQESAPSGPIWCRSLLDHVVVDGQVLIYDLKTTYSAHPESCAKSVLRFGYDVQREAYTRASACLWPEYAGRIRFKFLFVETEPPYAVLVRDLDSVFRERGRRRWERAVSSWSSCTATGHWPAYPLEPDVLEAPGWVLAHETRAELAAEEGDR